MLRIPRPRPRSARWPQDATTRLVAAIFIVTYLAFSIPALIAGVATTDFGLHQTAVYCAALATLGAVAAASLIFRRRSSAPVRDPAARPKPETEGKKYS
jgi:predicted MFS family arabinose efflux permease